MLLNDIKPSIVDMSVVDAIGLVTVKRRDRRMIILPTTKAKKPKATTKKVKEAAGQLSVAEMQALLKEMTTP
jgi:hypothetical protein